ncbi:cytochrome c [Thalassotalea sp. PS06]|uniref:c-type cytochrome n=1 Tax=Thalassotalea sp. PS06 TaxID=2594005 RepID=UPI0021B0C4C3|nr:c-type cytochrome [Thalassotalea sp. PS06]
MKKIILSAILGCGLMGNVLAQGDAEAGKNKAAVCAACHGANGIGTTDQYPNLAGQHADYIAKQLKAFKDGSRVDPVMAPMAANLSDQDMADLGAYFEGLGSSGGEAETATAGGAPAAPAAPAIVADAAMGKTLYEKGDASRGITACITCHGKDGDSEVLINPNLSNQHPEYIVKQLNSFKEHAATDGASGRVNAAMNQVAANLTEQDIADIGEFLKAPADVKEAAKAKKTVKVNHVGDVALGKEKSATCVACHSADGNSMVPMYPKLAGQSEQYLFKQLMDFKKAVDTNNEEGRVDPVMAGMVAPLSEQDMQNLAAYFASQKVSASAAQANERGKDLYLGGDASRGITACVACHGVDGQGMALAGFPVIGQQHTDYLKLQLGKFRDGTRGNDMNGMMRNIAAKLTDEDIDAVSQYMSSLK